MPRGSTTAKRQQVAANQRDIRHENGLVSPSKQARKKGSNSNSNGNSNNNNNNNNNNGHYNSHSLGHAKTPKSPKSFSSTPSPPATPSPCSVGYAHYATTSVEISNNLKSESGTGRKSSESSSDSSSEPYQSMCGTTLHEYHRQIDVNATKNPAVHRDLGPLSLAVTVLRSCPLSDTLAILIFLLQIPPTFISMIHFLFATLTFVPTSSVAASGLTYTDLLQVTLGTPSLTMILLLDLVVLLIWLFLRSPLQDIVLDLAQIVIALTLGGGTNEKDDGMVNILWCFGILGFSHFVRAVNVRNPGLRAFISSSFATTPDSDDPLETEKRGNTKRFGLIRSILAIHILTQGVIRYVREWYVKREKHDIITSIVDAEAGNGVLDSCAELSSSSLALESECCISSSTGSIRAAPKKKKKQCAQVRIRQPLWAALASTKIVMAKEYESSHTAAESAGTNATDLNNLGNAPFYSEVDRIWITYVGSNEIFFSTSIISTPAIEDEDDGQLIDHSSTDRAKPFYVKVNNSIWQSMKAYPVNEINKSGNPSSKWTGEIFGLAPTSNYRFDFISTMDESLLFSTSIRTLPIPSPDQGVSSSTKAGGRPSSPYTTLKASVQQAGKKLEEERQRQKSSRKELRVKLNAVRRDCERLGNSISSTGGNDDKLRQKAQQSTLHMKQADEAAAILLSQIETIDNIPTDETSLYSKSRNEIQSQREKHKNVRSEFNSIQRNAERDIQALRTDLSSLHQKAESRKQRLRILNTKYESIADANARGLDDAQRRETERDLKRKERTSIQTFYTERLNSIIIQIYEGQSALHVVSSVIETLLQVQQDAYQNHSPSPSLQNLSTITNSIPELPSGYPWNTPATSPNIFSSSSYSPMMSTVPPSLKAGSRTRGRSSSMLSNVSKFTQSSDEGPLLGVFGKKLYSREDTHNELKCDSGSPSGSGGGSIGDPKSPTVLNEKVTPAGK